MHRVRPATEADYDFLFALLESTMKEYVAELWGWEEEYQQKRFRDRFDPQRYQVVVVDGQDIGGFAVEDRGNELFLAEIQIAPSHQNQGWGAAILRDLMSAAEHRRIPLALRVLKINRARRLYERVGFQHIGETEFHFEMRWPQ